MLPSGPSGPASVVTMVISTEVSVVIKDDDDIVEVFLEFPMACFAMISSADNGTMGRGSVVVELVLESMVYDGDVSREW